MKKVLILVATVILGYIAYTTFVAPSDERALKDTFEQMDSLDAKDTENNISEEDIPNENTADGTTTNTETSASIDAALVDISGFSGTETTNPFEGL